MDMWLSKGGGLQCQRSEGLIKWVWVFLMPMPFFSSLQKGLGMKLAPPLLAGHMTLDGPLTLDIGGPTHDPRRPSDL